jgi:ubiquinone/menaquinone biosynthesis C-methylase UbiE
MHARPFLSHLFPTSARPATVTGHTLAAPRAYDAFANLFFFGRRRATYRALANAARVRPGQRVLDVGCGTGYFVRLLAQTVGPDGVVVGIDASPEMIDYARRTSRALNNCEFSVEAAEALSLPDQRFDVVVSSLFLHHLPPEIQSRAVGEMQRVLRPGGALLIAEAQTPRGGIWRLIGNLHGYDRMARAVPDIEAVVARAGFDQIRGGEAPPWLRYVYAIKP